MWKLFIGFPKHFSIDFDKKISRQEVWGPVLYSLETWAL